MFDFGFSELMVVMVVALVVIGPERLPKVARTLGHLWGRGQRYVNGVKSDIARDMDIEEFRQLQQTVQAEADTLGQSVKQATLTVDQQLQQINEAIAKLDRPGSANQLPTQTAAELPPQAATEAPPQAAIDALSQPAIEASGTLPANNPK